jgi:hypothetical protein
MLLCCSHGNWQTFEQIDCRKRLLTAEYCVFQPLRDRAVKIVFSPDVLGFPSLNQMSRYKSGVVDDRSLGKIGAMIWNAIKRYTNRKPCSASCRSYVDRACPEGHPHLFCGIKLYEELLLNRIFSPFRKMTHVLRIQRGQQQIILT